MNRRWKIAQYFERLWWQRYTKDADPTDYLNWKTRYWQDFLHKYERQIPYASAKNILDAGCGPAGMFIILSKHCTAIDPLLLQYEEKLLIFDRSWYPDVKFHNMSMEDMILDDQYDLVFCMNAINHVADLRKSLRNLFKYSSPGATLVLSVDVHRYNMLKSISRLIPADILHPHQDSTEDYLSMLEETGFKVENNFLLKENGIFDYKVFIAKKPLI